MFNSSIEFEKSMRTAGVLVMCDKCLAVGGIASVLVAGEDCFAIYWLSGTNWFAMPSTLSCFGMSGLKIDKTDKSMVYMEKT